MGALSSGVPVLTNSIGIEGIPADGRFHYLHCEEPQIYEEYIRMAVNGDISGVGVNGKEFVKKSFDLNESKEYYLKLLKTL